MKNRFKSTIGGLLLGLLIVEVIVMIGWTRYRYGGDYYYMKINHPTSVYQVTVPVAYAVNAFSYRGQAVDAEGHKMVVTLNTDATDPGPFKKGQVVRLTVNQHYGITNYKAVNDKNLIAKLKLDKH